MLQGIRNRWSLPISIRAMCGETRQTKPSMPVKDTMLAVAMVVRIR